MRLLFAAAMLAASMLTTAAVAQSAGGSSKATSTYAKGSKAYWTRKWYENQVRRGNYVKRNGKYVRRKGAVSSKRRRSSKRRTAKRSYSSGGRVTARVDLSSQRMTVSRGGRVLHSWPVSTGRSGYRTPTGTWRVHRMHKRYFSRKYDGAPMPYAMFYYRGFAIHGTNAIKRLGRPASHGCVRLHPSNAARLFSLVSRHGGTVRVVH